MVELGNRFAAGECFLPELMFGGMIMKGVMAELDPLTRGPAAGRGAGAPSSWARCSTTSTTSARTS